MKKILLTLLTCALLGSLLVACKKTDDEKPTPELAYDIAVTLDGDAIAGKQTVSFINTYSDGLASVPFHLYANCYAEDATVKAYNGILPKYGGIELTTVTVNDEKVNATLDESKQYLSVPLPSANLGDAVEIAFEYTIKIPESRLRFGQKDNVWLLSSFYPQLAAFDGEKFLTDDFTIVGDPLFSEIGDYSVSFTCPTSFVVASGAKTVSKTDEGETSTYRFSSENVRDFALAASPDFNVLTATDNDVTLQYFSVSQANAEERFALLRSAYNKFSETFGSPDLDVFTVAVVPFEYSGMEYSGIVYVSDTAGDETNDVILHETAHQWWYQLVGSDPIRNSALDEGLTTFTAAYYYLLSDDKATFDEKIADVKKVYTRYETLQKRRKTGINLRLDGMLYDYTAYQYTMLMYYKACMLFNNLYELYGAEKFNACLKAYAEEYAHKTATFDDFIAVCNKTLKTDVSGLVNGWRGDGSTVTTFGSSDPQ